MPTFRTLREGGEKLKGLISDAFSAPKKKKKAKDLSKNKALQAYNIKAGKKQSKKARDDAKLVKAGKLSKSEWSKRHIPKTAAPKKTRTEKAVGRVAAKGKKALKSLDYELDAQGNKIRKKNGYS